MRDGMTGWRCDGITVKQTDIPLYRNTDIPDQLINKLNLFSELY